MNIYKSAEDYLETILVLSEKLGEVHSIDVANELNFSKASVSVAMKKLRESNLIIFGPRNEIIMTDEGKRIAKYIYDKHQIIASFFKKIGVSETTALEDSCKVEHDISDETFQCLKKFVENN